MKWAFTTYSKSPFLFMAQYAISDIHGCLKTFQALLKKINFSQNDTLYLLGDYVDRGPDSKGVIDHIWALQEEGFEIYCLKGNHEDMLIDAATKSYGNNYAYVDLPCLNSFGVSAAQEIPVKYLRWMAGLPHFLEAENYILVHGGLNFNQNNPLGDKISMLWIRNWYADIDRAWLDGRIIIHGHTPTPFEQIQLDLLQLEYRPALVIDSGCVFQSKEMNRLCAFNLTTQELVFQPNIERFD